MARVSVLVCASAVMTLRASAVPPTITYQGQLKLDGVPVNGAADFRVRLWIAPVGGEIVAEAGPLNGIEIANGLFTLPLLIDAEPSVLYGGAPRYLEIQVAYPQGTDFIPLTPRQQITPAPVALYALYALDAPGGGGGGLTLPFAGTNTTNQAGIAVTNSGLAPAGAFVTDNPSNTQPAIFANTAGSGPALMATTGGSGPAVWGLTGDGGGLAGLFRVQGTSATQDALGVENSAMGSAGHFKTTKRENTNPALVVETFSDGPAATFTTHSDPNNVNLGPTVHAENNSFGMAGQFAIQNSDSTNDALRAGTNGGGNAIHAYTNGSGRAGFVEVENFGVRTVPAFEVVSNGRGAGAGVFRATNGLNGAPALEAITLGSGPAARFTHMNPGGQAADFNGDVSVTGTAVADAFAYIQPRVHHASLSPFDFKAASTRIVVNYFQGASIIDDPIGIPFLWAAPSIPDGVTITRLTVHVDDSSASINLEANLIYYAFDGAGLETVCTVHSSGNGGSQSPTTTTSHVVDTRSGWYAVVGGASPAWPSLDMKIKGAVIEYEVHTVH